MKKTAIIIASVMLIGMMTFPVFAVGGGGWGGGHYMRGYQNGPYCNWNVGNLSEEQRGQLDGIDQKFYNSTAELRIRIRTKVAELNSALAGTDLNLENLKGLQKEISDLRAEMAQKRLNYRVEIREIAPETAAYVGCGPGSGWGKGRRHRGAGYGPCCVMEWGQGR